MTLQQLIYFCELAKTLHYTKVSQKLNISQPALSYSIRELENDLNAKLFERHAKKISLTKEGELFYNYVEQALHLINEGYELLNTGTSLQQRRLNIGYIHSISQSYIPIFLDFCHKNNLNITFNFTQALSNDLHEGLTKGDYDIIFAVNETPGMINHLLVEQPLFLYVNINHPLHTKQSIALQDLAPYDMIMVNNKSQLRKQLETLFKSEGLKIKLNMEANNCEDVLSYIDKGYGLAIIPQTNLDKHNNVAEIKIDNISLHRKIYLSWSKAVNKDAKLAEKLLEFVNCIG